VRAAAADSVFAMPIWEERISPLLDEARRIRIVRLHDGEMEDRIEASFDGVPWYRRARELRERGVDVLVCGAVSRCLEEALLREGIRVVGRLCGEAEAVLRLVLSGRPIPEEHLLPGCRRGGRGGGRKKHCRRM